MMIIAFILVLLILIFAVYIFVLVRPRGRAPKSKALLTEYAHRGLHGGKVPENSLLAFELAVKEGYGIELDIQTSLDGVVMVFHDYTLKRMTGCDKKLSELTAAELGGLYLGGTDLRIPTFRQVLDLVDGKVPLLVELKGESFDTSLCQKAAELLKNYSGEYCIESFNPLLVGGMKKYLPESFRGQLYTNVCRDKKSRSFRNILLSCMALNFIAAPDFVAYNKYDRNALPVKIVSRLYRIPKFVWTVKGEEEFNNAKILGECPIFERTGKGEKTEAVPKKLSHK